MPLRTTKESEAERLAIEQEWETERAYPVANLSTTRRSGLSFVKASKTDAEWTAESRAGVSAADVKLSLPAQTRAREQATWYKDLVSSLKETSATSSGPSDPVASTSRVTLESSCKDGFTADKPIVLDFASDEEECREVHHQPVKLYQEKVSGHSTAALAVMSGSRSPPPSRPSAAPSPPEHPDTEARPGDMFCLVCNSAVSASDVPRHTTSILHQLSKDPSRTVAQPLIPPTYYGVQSSNVGYNMMKRLGWMEETGLGSSQTGRKTPIRAIEKFDRKGLGVDARKRQRAADDEGKVQKQKKQQVPQVAKPLAKNRKELEAAKKREMDQFKAGLAYLNAR